MHPYFDLNDDEKEEVRHADLVAMARANPFSGVSYAVSDVYRKAHDRIYGKACTYCYGPSLDRLFSAPPAEPVRGAEKTVQRSRLAALYDEIISKAAPKEME